MSALHPDWTTQQQIKQPAVCDFDELLESHPVLLREVMSALPHSTDFTSQRAKFMALREWIMLSSAFDIPCYLCSVEPRFPDIGQLWFSLGELWISESHVDNELFPNSEPKPVSKELCEPLQDKLLRWHTNLWLIQIEAAFQAWWRTSPNAVIAMLRPANSPDALEDISEQLLAHQPDLRAKSVATNTYPYRGRTTAAGRVFLYRPSEELVAWRKAQQESEQLQDNTPLTDTSSSSRRI